MTGACAPYARSSNRRGGEYESRPQLYFLRKENLRAQGASARNRRCEALRVAIANSKVPS